MPPARSAPAAPRRHTRTPPKGRAPSTSRPSSASRSARSSRSARTSARPAVRRARRIRWDKVGRALLLVVFAAVAGVYINQGLSLLSVKSQADGQRATVMHLIQQNRKLERQQTALNDPATIQEDARALGMVFPGERSYSVSGLPGH